MSGYEYLNMRFGLQYIIFVCVCSREFVLSTFICKHLYIHIQEAYSPYHLIYVNLFMNFLVSKGRHSLPLSYIHSSIYLSNPRLCRILTTNTTVPFWTVHSLIKSSAIFIGASCLSRFLLPSPNCLSLLATYQPVTDW